MSAIISPQPDGSGAVVAQTPLIIKKGKDKKTAAKKVEDPMSSVVAKLASLRERYLADMQAARERVKKNFLR